MIKSGKDYTVHSALNNLLNNPDYHIPAATVVSNERKICEDGKVTYMHFSQSQYSEQPFTIRCLKLKRKLFIALPSTAGVARLASK